LQTHDIEAAVARIEPEALEVLQRLVDTNSFSANTEGIRQTGEHIAAVGRHHGIDFRQVPVSGPPEARFHLLYDGRPPEDTRPFYVLLGHFDTVHEPQSGFRRFRREVGRWFGPGVLDMKAGLLTALYAVVVVREVTGQTRLPVKLLFNCDEETGSRDSAALIEQETAGAAGAFVFEGRRENDPALVTARKGIQMGSMLVHGRAAHAGEAPEKGASAIVAAAEKILQLHRLNDPGTGTVVTVGTVTGGTVANQVPDFCRAQIDVRFTTAAEGERVARQIAAIMAETSLAGTRTEYELVTVRPPFVQTEAGRRLLVAYQQAAARFGLAISERSAGGGSDANLTAALGVPTLDGLGPEGDGPHTDAEYIVARSFTDSIKAFALFLAGRIESEAQGDK
jgi:glutamate carboxypeptidase